MQALPAWSSLRGEGGSVWGFCSKNPACGVGGPREWLLRLAAALTASCGPINSPWRVRVNLAPCPERHPCMEHGVCMAKLPAPHNASCFLCGRGCWGGGMPLEAGWGPRHLPACHPCLPTSHLGFRPQLLSVLSALPPIPGSSNPAIALLSIQL